MRTVKFTVKSLSPMLMNADDIEWADQLREFIKTAGRKNTVAGDDRSPAWKWIGGVYNDGSQVVMPAVNLIRCLCNAAANFKKQGMKTYKQDMVTAISSVSDAFTLLVNGKPVPWKPIAALVSENDFPKHKAAVADMGFVLDVRRVVRNGKRNICVRPRFDSWSFTGALHVIDEQMTNDTLKMIFDYAGMTQGLGNYRPGLKSPGTYGKFAVVLE